MSKYLLSGIHVCSKEAEPGTVERAVHEDRTFFLCTVITLMISIYLGLDTQHRSSVSSQPRKYSVESLTSNPLY